MEQRRRRVGPQLLGFLAVATGWALVVTFLVQPFVVPSTSMVPTLQPGDRILVSKLTDGQLAERGDVVVFRDPGGWLPPRPASSTFVEMVREVAGAVGVVSPDDAVLVKRVIAVGGDRVHCCDDRGRVSVNHVPVDESDYLHPGDTPSGVEFEVFVPLGSLWVMGDHRSVSADSRAHLDDPDGGALDRELVIGRAVAVVWPPTRVGTVRTSESEQD